MRNALLFLLCSSLLSKNRKKPRWGFCPREENPYAPPFRVLFVLARVCRFPCPHEKHIVRRVNHIIAYQLVCLIQIIHAVILAGIEHIGKEIQKIQIKLCIGFLRIRPQGSHVLSINYITKRQALSKKPFVKQRMAFTF